MTYPRPTLWIGAAGLVALGVAVGFRIARVTRAASAIPVYPGAREGSRHTRYWPHLISWDDRSSARVQRVFALPESTSLGAIAHHADTALVAQGWYLVTPNDFERFSNPQVIVWQREPGERLDLTQLWPISGMSRTQRLYGGTFPPEFLDAPMVFGWSWALGGPRSPPPAAPRYPVTRRAPPPPSR